MIGFLIRFFRFFLLVLVVGSVTHAAGLVVQSPIQDFKTASADIVIKGQALGAHGLKINGVYVSLDDQGFFNYRDTLPSPNMSYNYDLAALSSDYKISTVSRRIHYRVPPIIVRVAPSLSVSTPVNNFVSYKRKILFKGRVDDVDSLSIDGESAVISKEGTFFHKVTIPETVSRHSVSVVARQTSGVELKQTIQIFYKGK